MHQHPRYDVAPSLARGQVSRVEEEVEEQTEEVDNVATFGTDHRRRRFEYARFNSLPDLVRGLEPP